MATTKKSVKKGARARKSTRKATAPRSASPSRATSRNVSLLIGTYKGAFFLRSTRGRRTWSLEGPHFLGSQAHHVIADPREPGTILMGARTGHLGPTVYRSTDGGKSWKEASRPPAFPKAKKNRRARTVHHVFWLTPGHESEPGVWYAGTSPQGLFRSKDGGDTWKPVKGFNEHKDRDEWAGTDQEATPDGGKLHSIIVDPRDPSHLYVSMSGGGTFEGFRRGKEWRPLNQGVVAPMPLKNPEYGHDPHCVVLHPANPDRLYQQNHCGIYRLDRPGEKWIRIGKNMPRSVGDIGFPIVVHPEDPDRAWVFPMDGTMVWPRVCPGGVGAVYTTTDAGRTWKKQARGLPRKNAWFTVYRQAMATDTQSSLGIYLGTTCGEIWGSTDEGENWKCLASHLPKIYSVETVQL